MMEGIYEEIDGRKYVGKLEIFDQQIEAAKQCFDVFVDHDLLGQSPILLGECQSGKTGSAVVLIKMFINWCEYRGINKDHREIYFAINSSNNDLLEQLNKRLMQCGLSEEIIHFHHAHYKKKKNYLSDDIKARLFIVDECHIALCSNDSVMKPYQHFLHDCGISLGENKKMWKNQNNFVLQISATPNPQVMHNEYLDEKPFKFVYLKNSPLYLSLSDMLVKNRVEQSYQLLSTAPEIKNQASPWFKERMKDFYNLTKSEYGVMILRLTGTDKVYHLKRFINKQYPDMFSIVDFSSRNKNISTISDYISDPLAKPLIAIVRGSLREGKTLETTKYIRMVIDSHDTKSSTVVQGLLGRCCGYPSNGHSRHNDKFKIFCDADETFEHELMIQGLRNGESPVSIASSRYNKKSSNSKKYNYKINILPLNSIEAKNLMEERKKRLDDYADSNQFRSQEVENYRKAHLSGTTNDDLDTYVEKQILKQKSVTAQKTNKKSMLLKNLLERFEKAHFDYENNCFRVTSGAQVSSNLNYEILDGHYEENVEAKDIYIKLFNILKTFHDLDINQHYVIFYEEDVYNDVSNQITIDKMNKSILKDVLT